MKFNILSNLMIIVILYTHKLIIMCKNIISILWLVGKGDIITTERSRQIKE